MQGVLIFLFSSVFVCGTYLVWPSRHNVMAHLNVAFIFIAYFVPAIILEDQQLYKPALVTLYITIIGVGAFFFVLGLFTGFSKKRYVWRPCFSFVLQNPEDYETRVIKITQVLLICGVIGQVIAYVLMGFVPAFAAEPLAAKFFRGQYQVPFYVSIVYLSSFFILSTMTPVALMVWYKYKTKIFFLLITLVSIVLMLLSLSRGPAFGGVVLAIVIIMSFKSRKTFILVLVLLFVFYSFSSVFYYIIGVRDFADLDTVFIDDRIFWRLLSSGTVDITDQLTFLTAFDKLPVWTYGRTILGGLIPSHYKWNPSVYTLKILYPKEDVTTLISGGLRLPAPIWGYVSFQWFGVVSFCFLSGYIKGVLLKYTKKWIAQNKSILTTTVIVVINLTIFEQLSNFFVMTIYVLPPTAVLVLYMYRFRLR